MPFYTHHIVPDSPINNFATFNPLVPNANLEDGNLKLYSSSANAYAFSNIAVTTGKWYFEYAYTAAPSTNGGGGITFDASFGTSPENNGTRYIPNNGHVYHNGQNVAHADTYTTGDVIGVFVDTDEQKVIYFKNEVPWVSINNISSLGSVPFYFFLYNYIGTQYGNFGQNPSFGGHLTGGGGYTDANGIGQFNYPFAYDYGASALCTKNLSEGYIKLSQDQTPSDHFKALTYVGDNQASRTHTVGFPADLVWVKNRDYGNSHNVYDSVRGYGSASAGNNLQTDQTYPENYYGTYGYVSSVTSTEITFDSGTTNDVYVNRNEDKMVAWFWRAAGSPDQDYASANDGSAKIINEDGSANTSIQDCAALASAAGASITPTKVSANRQNGFSIVKWNNQGTVPHGLSKAPEFIIVKSIDQTSGWWVYATALGNSNYGLPLHSSAAPYTGANWGGSPDANVFYVTNGQTVLPNTSNSIAYCWHSVAGYSAFGSVANLNNDEYVYLGFRPSLVMLKRTSDTSNWSIYDNARNPHNVCDKILFADKPNSEIFNGSVIVSGVVL